MDNPGMATRRGNRTIYILDVLFNKATELGKRKDRSASRIIEYALVDYLRKNGIDPETDATDDSSE